MKTFTYKLLNFKNLRFFYLLAFLLFVGFSYGQSGKGTISGTVKDSTGSPITQASVLLKGTDKGTYTNNNGDFTLKNVPEGSQTIVIQMFGYKTLEKQVNVKAGETTAIPDITLNQDIHELEQVVINSQRNRYVTNIPSSSLRIQTPLIEIPQNIQVVTNDVLKDQQVISMSDGLIRNVSGLVRAEHWGDLYTNITARGSQIQAFRNGFNVVNSSWGPLTEDMSFVDHIEFVKGPAGFMLSSGDPSGLYNVVTKKPTGITRGEVSFTLGSFNLYRTALDLDGKLNENGRLLYRLNLAAQNKNSHRPNEYNNRYTIAPVVSYQLDDKTLLTAEYTYQRADMSNVGSFYVFSPKGFETLPRDFSMMPAGLPGTKINDHSFFLNLQHQLSGNWKITGQVSRFIYDQVGTSMWPSDINPDGTIIRGVGIWDAKSRMNMAQVFLNGDVKTGSVRHRVLAGLDIARKNYLADWNTSRSLDTVGAAFNPNDPDYDVDYVTNGYPQFDRSLSLEERAYSNGSFQDQTYSSVYVQDELGFFDNILRVTIAGRYTDLKEAYYGTKEAGQFTPRAGASASVRKDMAVYALYDQAFVPQSGKLANGNKVQPITGNNMEVGIKKDWFGGNWNTTLAVYQIVKNNELTPDPFSAPGSGLSIELGQKTVQGIEFDLRGTIVKGLNLIANYAYTDSRVTKISEGVTVLKVGDIVPGFSKHTLNGWLNYKLQQGILKGAGVSLGGTWLGDRATYWQASPDPNKELENYFKLDGGLFWENNRIRIAANVFNIMDEYLYSGSYFGNYFSTPVYSWQTEPGRNYRLSINYKF
ncbi:MAG: TonB-dependent receptor [Cytophagaceae bacterium]|nr:TonB-dependent receptor [Cytophagaceae bacterium]